MLRVNITCAQCGATALRHSTAKYCMACTRLRAKTRVAGTRRRADGLLQPRKVDGVWTCLDCPAPADQKKYGKRIARPSLRCDNCAGVRHLFTHLLSGRSAAANVVATARRHGLLPPATHFPCADCGRPAEQYEHRDYGQPLQVEPVCRSCNQLRGHARPLDQRIVLGLLAEAVRAHGISLCPIEPLNATQRS